MLRLGTKQIEDCACKMTAADLGHSAHAEGRSREWGSMVHRDARSSHNVGDKATLDH